MLRRLSSSVSTSPGAVPMPKFQYVDPGTIISQIRNRWLIESITCTPPPRRSAETAAPILRRNSPPLASATYPARSISALVSADRLAK